MSDERPGGPEMPSVVLLDAHAFLWFALGDPQMPALAQQLVVGAAVAYVSAASVWEIRTKHRLGKLDAAAGLVGGLPGHIRRLGLAPLGIEVEDADRAGALRGLLQLRERTGTKGHQGLSTAIRKSVTIPIGPSETARVIAALDQQVTTVVGRLSGTRCARAASSATQSPAKSGYRVNVIVNRALPAA